MACEWAQPAVATSVTAFAMLARCPASRRRSGRSSWPTKRSRRASTSKPWSPICRRPSAASRPRARNVGRPWRASGSARSSPTRWATSTAGRAWFARARRLRRGRAAVHRAGLGGGGRDGVRRRRSRRLLGGRRAGARPGPPFRRRQPRDQGAGRCRAGPRASRAGRRGDGAARRGDGAGLRAGRRHRRRPPSRLLVLHGLLRRRRLRARGIVGRPARASTG